MISVREALEIARREVDRLEATAGFPVAIIETKTIERPFGWVFFYNSRRFLETRDPDYAVGGNAPIIVDREDGSVHFTGTARPVEYYMAEYERTRGQRASGPGAV